MQSLTYLKSRRMWVVRDQLIWGTENEIRLHYLVLDNSDGAGRLMFGTSGIGGSAQGVLFADLIDFRGNRLPSRIESPKVLIRPRSAYGAFLIGDESDSGFKAARDNSAPGAVRVDYFIYEMGT